MREYDEDEYDLLDPFEGDEDEEVADERLPPPTMSLKDMEKHCEEAARIIDERLGADPDYPTGPLLVEVRQHVKPLSAYRATESEQTGLGLMMLRARVWERIRQIADEDENDSQQGES